MKNQKAALGFIFITVLIDVTGLGIIIPVLPQLITELTGGTISDASIYGGWLMFAYAFMQFLCAPVLGGLSDQFGRRPVLLFALFGFGIDYIFMALAPTVWWLFLGRIVAGVTGASFTTASAYIADVSSPEKRAQNFGMIGAAFGLGFIVGPMTGGILGEFGSRVPFYAAAGLTLVNWLYGYFVLPESLSPENRRKFSWKRANPWGTLVQLRNYPTVIGLIASLVLVYIAAHATQSTWAYFTIEKFDWSEAQVGYSLAFVGFMIALVQGVIIRPVVNKIGQTNAVYAGLAFNALGFIMIALATQGWMLYAIMIPYAFGGLAGPSLQGIMSNSVNANEQGELQGGLTSLVSVTSIVGPPLMTGIFGYFTATETDWYLPSAPFYLGAVFALLSLVFAVRTLSAKKAS
ncbi:TCR/Tet family MFS transporter [Marinoscillum luteum]|uniref:TCR/Tet family MFS transporter n=1 Tax=Marinoscillum luteum TaxID=861051 RepID=A0ABW7NCH2_9BACT